MHRHIVNTLMGRVCIRFDQKGINGVSLTDQEEAFGEPTKDVLEMGRRIKKHLLGQKTSYADLPLNFDTVPEFARKIYRLMLELKPGETLSYSELATRAGKPSAARAVGTVVGKNPWLLVVPCHRILGAKGALGGFSAPGGIITKSRLLALEEVEGYSPQTFPQDMQPVLKYLAGKDKPMGEFIQRAGAFGLKVQATQSVFQALAESIVYQQLTAKAAQTIWNRLLDFCEAQTGEAKELFFSSPSRILVPAKILAKDVASLRTCGLSEAKARSLLDLAKHCEAGIIPPIEVLQKLPDEHILELLTKVRGIGPWTAQMFLMFRLGRADVCAPGDLALRKALARLWNKKEMSPNDFEKGMQKFKPWRTVASWYLWRIVDEKLAI